MKTRSILKLALVGILLTAFVAPNAMAQTSYQYAMSSQITSGHVGSWLLNINETISVNQNQVLGYGYKNTFNNNDPSAGPCDLYRLGSTNPSGGLNPSLSGMAFNVGLSSGPYSPDPNVDTVTVSGTAQHGTTYPMSTSHYYYPRNYPGQVYYPPTGAVKAFTVA